MIKQLIIIPTVNLLKLPKILGSLNISKMSMLYLYFLVLTLLFGSEISALPTANSPEGKLHVHIQC